AVPRRAGADPGRPHAARRGRRRPPEGSAARGGRRRGGRGDRREGRRRCASARRAPVVRLRRRRGVRSAGARALPAGDRHRPRRPPAPRLPHADRGGGRRGRSGGRGGAAMSAASPEAVIWNAVRGALATRALAIVADLRVAEALAAGPRSVDAVAAEVGADADTLHRLLRALASDGVFAEDAPGVFRNTEPSELLRSSGWDDFAHLFGPVR